jgi:hypothetical protein
MNERLDIPAGVLQKIFLPDYKYEPKIIDIFDILDFINLKPPTFAGRFMNRAVHPIDTIRYILSSITIGDLSTMQKIARKTQI